MWEVRDFAVIAMALLGCVFPAMMIDAVRADDKERADRKKIEAGLCFGGMILILGMLLNS